MKKAKIYNDFSDNEESENKEEKKSKKEENLNPIGNKDSKELKNKIFNEEKIKEKEGFIFDRITISPLKNKLEPPALFEIFNKYKNFNKTTDNVNINNNKEFNFDKDIIPPIINKNESSSIFQIYENYQKDFLCNKNKILPGRIKTESSTITKMPEKLKNNSNNTPDKISIEISQTPIQKIKNDINNNKIETPNINQNNEIGIYNKENTKIYSVNEKISINDMEKNNILKEIITKDGNNYINETVNLSKNDIQKNDNKDIQKIETKKEKDNNNDINTKTPENNQEDKIDKKSQENKTKTEGKKNVKKIKFSFDQVIIKPCGINNINIKESSKVFPILETFKNEANQNLLKDINNLIIKSAKQTKSEPFIDKLFNSFEETALLSIKKDDHLKPLNIKEENSSMFEEINNIIEVNKRINIFEKKENSMICQRLLITPEEKNEEKKLNNFQEVLNYKNSLYEKTFNGDKSKIKDLKFEDIDYFSTEYPIANNYHKKYIKYFSSNNKEDIGKKVKNLFINDDKENEENTISWNNQRRIKKKENTWSLENPKIDEKKIFINYDNLISSSINIDKIDEIYNISNIKSISPDTNENQKIIKFDYETENIITKIFYSFIPEKINSPKIKIESDQKETESLENIKSKHDKQYLKNMDLNNNCSEENNIDIFDNIDLNNIDNLFNQYENEKKKEKEDYRNSGKASIQLLKTNSKTSFSRNISLKLNEINNITDNEEIKNISKDFTNNKTTLNYEKQLIHELNRSLVNKYISNNRKELLYKSNSRLNSSKNINSVNNESNEKNNEKERDYFAKKQQKIKNINDQMNKKERKRYINKSKIQQENQFEDEIKKEKRFKALYSLFFLIIPLIYSFYHKIVESNN